MENIDLSIFKFIHFTLKNEFLDIILPYCRNKTTWIPLYLILIYIIWKKYRQDYWKIILGAIITVAISDILCAKVLKVLFIHPRPCQLYLNQAWFSDFQLCSQTFSMPSCHASNHAALVAFLFPFVSKYWKWALSFWVILIGYSQIYVGVHFPKDILAGYGFGIVFGLLFSVILNTIQIKISESFIKKELK